MQKVVRLIVECKSLSTLVFLRLGFEVWGRGCREVAYMYLPFYIMSICCRVREIVQSLYLRSAAAW